ncbi:MAG: PHP domain-containing protein [Candidatus Nanohalobium sp.]
MGKADLHMHTTASDGTDTVKERIQDAEMKGLDVIAITDHDTINSELSERSFTAENGVEVITGAEIKCSVEDTKVEILGYFLDPKDKEVQSIFREMSENRERRMKEFVENLNDSYGLGLEASQVIEKAEGNVGRPHLAEALREKGVVDSDQEAFDTYIGSGEDEYVPVDKPSAGEVIDAVHESGGVASLAHPGRSLEEDAAAEKVRRLVGEGLDAIEVEYGYSERKDRDLYDIYFGVEKARELAERFDLLKTGGSDCHGQASDKYFLGSVTVPLDRVEALREKARELQG